MATSAYSLSNIDSNRRSYTVSSHGFAVGDWLYYTGSAWAKAKADTSSTAECAGVVSNVRDANTFTLTTSGYVSGLSGLTAGSPYFLSAATAGAITATEPTTIGYISKPILHAISTTEGILTNYRGMVVGGTTGKLIQRVSNESSSTFSTTTVIPLDNTIPQITEGAELITCSITPTSTSNKLIISIHGFLSPTTAHLANGALFIDSTANALKSLCLGTIYATDWTMPMNATFEITPTSTSSQTYRFRIGPSGAATIYANRLNSYNPVFNSTSTILMQISEVSP